MERLKILVIDDEKWAAKDISSIVNIKYEDFFVVDEVYDYENALKSFTLNKPDIVLCDIRMGERTGLELAQDFIKTGYNFKLVFISAHSEFEYAKTALKLGASDYLNKPVNETELFVTLEILKRELNDKRENEEKQKILHFSQAVIEAYDNGNCEYLKSLLEAQYHFDKEVISLVVVICSKLEGLLQKILTWSSENEYKAAVGQIGLWKYVLFLNLDTSNRTEQILLRLDDFARQNKIHAGISKPVMHLANLNTAITSADMVSQGDFFNKPCGASVYCKDYIKNVMSLFDEFNEPQILLEELKNSNEADWLNGETVMQLYNNYVALLRSQDIEISDEPLTSYSDIISQFPNYISFLGYLNQLLHTDKVFITDGITHKVIRQIVNEIYDKYSEPIMLSDFADKYFFSASYLSILFKQQTGKTFSEFLIDIRMKRAEKLIRETDLSLYKISSKAGYTDYFHFSKQFKKIFGVSPNEYRRVV